MALHTIRCLVTVLIGVMLLVTAYAILEGSCPAGNCDVDEDISGDRKYHNAQSPCPYPPPELGEFRVDTQIGLLGDEEIAALHPEVELGGTWQPRDCVSRQTVAVIVPYRDRLQDLRMFLPNIHRFLQKQLIHYTIFLIEQTDEKHFNRAALLNIGFVAATKMAAYDCIILHDVDKYPEDSRNLYMCSDQPTHLVSKLRYVGSDYRQRPYEEYFGGVTAINNQQFRKVNGFSNIFWGWGSEDDDFLNRMKYHGLRTRRVDDDVGRYREIWHPYGFVNPRRHEVNKDGKNRFDKDGLNSLYYKQKSITKEPLYTHVKVKLLHEDPYDSTRQGQTTT